MRPDYAERLSQPEWYSFREIVLEVKGRFCEHCDVIACPPNIHHCGYVWGREPWEYSMDEVKVLCPDCHKRVHERTDEVQAFLYGLDEDTLCIILKIFAGLMTVEQRYQPIVAERIFCWMGAEKHRIEWKNYYAIDGGKFRRELYKLKKFLLSVNANCMDPLLDAIDIFKLFPEGEQYRSATNVAEHLSSWTPPEPQKQL